MISNITSNSPKELNYGQALLTGGDRVYLYGDTQYTGTLIRPVERTYPPKWTVELDRGGFDAVNIDRISSLEPQLSTSDNLEIPFSDSPESEKPLETEIIALKQKIKQLQQQNQEL